MENFKMRNIILGSLSIIFLLSNIYADEIGIDAKIGTFKQEISGDFKYNGDNIDTSSDLGLNDNSDLYISVSFDHPIPLIPNLKIEMSKIGFSKIGKIKNEIEFAGQKYSKDSLVKETLVLDQTDATLYYRFLDNYFRFYFGINIKNVDGYIQLDNQRKDFSETIPMLYSQVAIDFDNLKLIVEGSYFHIDSTIYDSRIYVQYEKEIIPFIKLGAEVGYRKELFNLEDVSNVNTDLNIDGVFAGLYIRF